ncbi:hypothetical protein AGMMS49545_02750 [Betaproteobacteria bacterium]|nr:hypothetical protein AGMMS49545_02750 [Betaproteobacteria bacterium]GHU40336.1 hypothetical protein AGMMS50289_01720 [Betaproteobacteria bacterium]
MIYGKKIGMVAFLVMLLLSSGCSTFGVLPAEDDTPAVGVKVGALSGIRTMVSAEKLEKQAENAYQKRLKEAENKEQRVPADDAEAKRLDAIGKRMIPVAVAVSADTEKYADAAQWTWEVNLIRSEEINAFCMPGGKIAFYTGLIDKLEATDDELAMVMGHEIAHALREHARAQAAKGQLTSIGATVLGMVVGKGQFARVFDFANDLLNLQFSRDDEGEADLIGLELAARAGYDPRAGVSLWQKMDKANSGASIPFLSTHPSSENRIREIEAQLPSVLPLYESAEKPEALAQPQQKEAEQTPEPQQTPAKKSGRGSQKNPQKTANKPTRGG